MLAEQYQEILEKVHGASVRSGRKETDVTLIAVSKTHPVSAIAEVYEAGCRDFGENKVQELVAKYDQLPNDIRWHMIGHLQTNKVKYIADKVYMIHSVDSYHLACEISKEAAKQNRVIPILIEVNIAKEESKFGVMEEDATELVRRIALLPNVKIRGLMTIAPYVDDPEKNRQYFVGLKHLSVDIARQNIDNVDMDVLSMGMSGDYQVATEEGATYTRVGTGIFGKRDYMV